MTTSSDFQWSERERLLLERMLALIIPPAPDRGIPSAAALGIADHLAREAGADEYLEKPFTGDMLREKLALVGLAV